MSPGMHLICNHNLSTAVILEAQMVSFPTLRSPYVEDRSRYLDRKPILNHILPHGLRRLVQVDWARFPIQPKQLT